MLGRNPRQRVRAYFRQASSNYGIGYDGRIGMYVEEKDRSWCSSNAANDNRAITIEVASDTKEPYAVTVRLTPRLSTCLSTFASATVSKNSSGRLTSLLSVSWTSRT